MSNIKSQVDYILINRKWINTIKDVSAYDYYASLGSDHRVLRALLKISFRKRKTPERLNYDWSILNSNAELQSRYSVHVQNRYMELCQDHQNATQQYENLIIANDEAAKELIPKKEKQKRKQIAKDPRIVAARDDVKKSFQKYQNNKNATNEFYLQEKKAALQSAYNQVLEEDLANDIGQIENSDNMRRHTS